MRKLVARYHVDVALVGVAAVWGFTFVTVKDAVEVYPPYSFMAIRFAIAAVALAVIFPRSLAKLNRRLVGAGALAGVVLALGYVGQTLGLMEISASRAGFITGMFIVITPLLQFALLRRKVGPWSLAGVVAATTGLWLLTGAGGGGWTNGDSLTLLAAASFSAHMIVLGAVSGRYPTDALTLVQLLTVALVTGVAAVFTERPLALPSETSVWVALLVTGVVASAIAFAVQTYAQRHISPTRTALILITEPVFAGLFGFALLAERLTLLGWVGSGLILTGMLVSEIGGNLHRAREKLLIET